MTRDEFRAICAKLGLEQKELCILLGYSHNVLYSSWRISGIPKPVAILMRLLERGIITPKHLKSIQTEVVP